MLTTYIFIGTARCAFSLYDLALFITGFNGDIFFMSIIVCNGSCCGIASFANFEVSFI